MDVDFLMSSLRHRRDRGDGFQRPLVRAARRVARGIGQVVSLFADVLFLVKPELAADFVAEISSLRRMSGRVQ